MSVEAVRVRQISLPAEMQAKNRDKIVRDKAARGKGGRRRNRSGRQWKIDGGETSRVDFTEGDHSTDGWLTASKNMS